MKHLLKLVLQVTGRAGLVRYIFLGLLTGFSSFLFLNMVTRVMGLLIPGNYTVVSKEYLLIFSAVILTFIWSRRSLSIMIIYLSLRMSWGVRKQILTLALRAGYPELSAHRTEVQTAIQRDVDVLTNAAMAAMGLCLSIIMTLSCLIYMASISLLLFFITLGVSITGCLVYYITSRENVRAMEKSRNLENSFLRHFNAIIFGFKEIHMDRRKGEFIYEKRIIPISRESFAYDSKAVLALLNNQITGQVLFYLLITSILIYFSVSLSIKPADVVSFVFTTLYLLGSIEGIMLQFPAFVRAAVSADHLTSLRQQLEKAGAATNHGTGVVTNHETGAVTKHESGSGESVLMAKSFGGAFEVLEVSGLEFRYPGGESSCSIGPVDLTLRSGETVFIYGGNGSGKTTFINAMLRLTRPSAGEIRLNGVLMEEANVDAYKRYFSVVFSDFFLFEEVLTGISSEPAKWDHYLSLFELSEKVTLSDGRFSTVSLSSAQRKRLALAIALMEEKPILVLDEWAADQDPHFRKKFYREIIPLLNEQGITILAVTHDDAYYQAADRLFKMEEGRLEEQKSRIPGEASFY